MSVPTWASDASGWAKTHKGQAVGLGAAMVLVLLVSPSGQSASPPQLLLAEPAGGLLADVRGEDVLRRLQAGHAALQREMALVRKWLSEGGDLSTAETDLAKVVSEVQAEHADLEGFVGLLEAGQARLLSIVFRCQAELSVLHERLGALEAASEGN